MDQAARKLSIADGRMTVEGLAGGFVQDAGRPLRLEADGLVAVAGQLWREGALHEAGRIEARAWPAGASLRRIGFPGEAQTLALTIRPFPHDGGKAPLLRLGLADDAAGGLDDGFAAELFLPQLLYAALHSDLAAGRAGLIAFTASTNLWLREDERPDEPASFHLGLEAGGLRTASAHGRVETIEWRPAAATEPGVAAAQAAADAADEEPPEDPVAEQLRRINWSLKQLLIVFAFLMLIVALK
jgi:hypothetical protein